MTGHNWTEIYIHIYILYTYAHMSFKVLSFHAHGRCSKYNKTKPHRILYIGYFSGGKIFVSSEFLASFWKHFRGRGTVRMRKPNYAVMFRE